LTAKALRRAEAFVLKRNPSRLSQGKNLGAERSLILSGRAPWRRNRRADRDSQNDTDVDGSHLRLCVPDRPDPSIPKSLCRDSQRSATPRRVREFQFRRGRSTAVGMRADGRLAPGVGAGSRFQLQWRKP
jgi:hypothetical protein